MPRTKRDAAGALHGSGHTVVVRVVDLPRRQRSPGSASSSPVARMATRGRRITLTLAMPMEASTPISGRAQDGALGQHDLTLADVFAGAADVGA